MSHLPQHPAAPDAGLAGRAEALDQLVTMIPTIAAGLGDLRAAVAEILRVLDGRQKPQLTVEEVAKLTGRAPYTVRTWIKEGRIAAIRVTGTGPKGRLLIPREEIRKLISSGLGDQLPVAVTD